MAKFNTAAVKTDARKGDTVNLAGGRAFKESNKLELVSLLLTSFVQDQFYRKAEEGLAALTDCLARLPEKHFAAQAMIYARQKFGMRSVTHAGAAELTRHVKGEPWLRRFYKAVVHRPDDVLEILAYYQDKYGKHPIPAAMKRGLADALAEFDAYRLAKYKGEGKGLSLVDAVNLLHPKPKESNAEAFKQLMNGTLPPAETWETKLTQAGQLGEGEEGKLELKAAVWRELVNTGKIGQFALLRNLRNICEQAPDVIPAACALLTNEERVRKSLILPFRYLTAAEQLTEYHVVDAVHRCVDIALANVPKLEGKTLVALDCSGSMEGKPWEIGSLFAAVLWKTNDADLLTFDNSAHWVRGLNLRDSVMGLARSLPNNGGGTDFRVIFNAASVPYQRIIILSDMQAWVGGYMPATEFTAYKKRTGADPFIYSFNLQGYGTLQFPEAKVLALAGFSEKIFEIMPLLEGDRAALVHEIERVEF